MPTIQFRRGTKSEWADANPVLASGEPGFETDTGRSKIGDGARPWSLLPYILDADAMAERFNLTGAVASTDGTVRNIRVLTQAAYEALTPDATTMYVIVD